MARRGICVRQYCRQKRHPGQNDIGKSPGSVHGGHADRLRYPSRGGRNAHHAVALSRRSLERAGGEPGHRWPRSHQLSAEHAAVRPRPTGGPPTASRAAIWRWSSAARSTSSARSHAICNVLYGAQAVYDPYMASAFCKAINDWIAAEWLARDPRLRASIVVPMQAPDLAIEEIERRAGDNRFVSVLVLAQGESLLGGGITGRSIRPPRNTNCRSRSMPAASTARRRVRSAGRPIATNIILPRRRRSRPRC